MPLCRYRYSCKRTLTKRDKYQNNHLNNIQMTVDSQQSTYPLPDACIVIQRCPWNYYTIPVHLREKKRCRITWGRLRSTVSCEHYWDLIKLSNLKLCTHKTSKSPLLIISINGNNYYVSDTSTLHSASTMVSDGFVVIKPRKRSKQIAHQCKQ